MLCRCGGECIHSDSTALWIRRDCDVFGDGGEMRAVVAGTRHQIGLAGVLMRELAMPDHLMGMRLRCTRECRIPAKRPKTMLGAVLVGRLHQLPGLG